MSKRFTIAGELNRIDAGLTRDAQKDWGQSVEWFRFDPDATSVDDVYDVGASRRYRPAILLPCLWVVMDEATDTHRREGLYGAESLQVAIAKTVFRDKLQWDDLEIDTNQFLRDRISYDDRVFKVSSFQIQGELRSRETIIGVQAEVVRPEQHVFDPEFTPPPPA